MTNKTLGFIGGGRITFIILEGLRRCGKLPEDVMVSDFSIEALEKLKRRFPEIDISVGDNKKPACQEIVFLALHPQAINSVFLEIKSSLKKEAIIISLAPKIMIEKLSEGLGGFRRIARMIPNTCSIINSGYNPIAFSSALSETEKEELKVWLGNLGDCPIVDEEKLEAYALLTAMGPTYLWFQLYELEKIAVSFGLTPQEAQEGISKMMKGTLKNYIYEADLSPEEVMNLIPVKPLKDEEENIKNIYRSKLEAVFKKIEGKN
ncbi:MAG: NAD(P)-binding domain-containing protein [Candidatus Omnitrophica bacterium]|nr:NAD(P)-binding domain-containing protein [Candidatus Omnitrophota bacterium]